MTIEAQYRIPLPARAMMDHLDRRIIEALRRDPRAPWSKLAPLLSADASTLSRRWDRLVEAGCAWVTTFPETTRLATAIVEVTCRTGETAQVVDKLQLIPQVLSLDTTSGDTQITAVVAGDDWDSLVSLASGSLLTADGITSHRVHFVEEHVWEAGIRPLRGVGTGTTNGGGANATQLRQSENDAAIAEMLMVDGRTSSTAIAEHVIVGARRVRDRLVAMLRSGRLVQRVDVGRDVSDRPRAAWLFIDVPPAQLEAVAGWLAQSRATRTVAVVAGHFDLAVHMWLTSVGELRRLESSLTERFPGARVVRKSVVLRTKKIWGHLLDDHGRRVGYVLPTAR